MHALFELSAAAKQEKLALGGSKLRFSETFTPDDGFRIEPVTMDEAFLNKYTLLDLPYLKSSDLIFVAMAKVDGDILITEDESNFFGRKRRASERSRLMNSSPIKMLPEQAIPPTTGRLNFMVNMPSPDLLRSTPAFRSEGGSDSY